MHAAIMKIAAIECKYSGSMPLFPLLIFKSTQLPAKSVGYPRDRSTQTLYETTL